jgi:hypothetical protein
LWFQSRACKEVTDVNGLTNEVLLLAIIDRLRAYQDSKYACEENEEALQSCVHALDMLNLRTDHRVADSVEGSHEVHTTGQKKVMTIEGLDQHGEAMKEEVTVTGTKDEVQRLRGFLARISKGEGRFSQDHLEHATNTVEDMKVLAAEALAGISLEDASD